MSNDAIVLLKNDHKEIRRLFREFSATGAEAHAAEKPLVRRSARTYRFRTRERRWSEQ